MKDRILSSEQALGKINDGSLILLDIRRIDEWKTTGIGKGAVPLTMDDQNFMQTLKTLTNNDTNKGIGIICAAGGRSARICQALSEQGYDFVYDISEGMSGGPYGVGWLHKNLPIVTYTE